MNMESALIPESKAMAPEKSAEELEMANVRRFAEQEVEAKLNGNHPQEKYHPMNKVTENDFNYIERFTDEVNKIMADPKRIAEIKAYLANVNRPDRRWN